mgnify:CR=1 FL=1
MSHRSQLGARLGHQIPPRLPDRNESVITSKIDRFPNTPHNLWEGLVASTSPVYIAPFSVEAEKWKIMRKCNRRTKNKRESRLLQSRVAV